MGCKASHAITLMQRVSVAGADALKDALTKLGLKCGGTLRQRAERLILTKTTPVEKLDRKLFAKGVVPAVSRIGHSCVSRIVITSVLCITRKDKSMSLQWLGCWP